MQRLALVVGKQEQAIKLYQYLILVGREEFPEFN